MSGKERQKRAYGSLMLFFGGYFLATTIWALQEMFGYYSTYPLLAAIGNAIAALITLWFAYQWSKGLQDIVDVLKVW